MKTTRSNLRRGSVALMTLCFVAAMAIGVVGYLAVALQTMNLGNRSYQSNVSQQMAGMGLEQALWAINRNDWSGWTLSGTTATRTISIAATTYGAIGTSGTIKLRVDNYNAYFQDAAWSSSTSYYAGDLVGYSGTWYRCVLPNSGNTPSTSGGSYGGWVPDQSPISVNWNSGNAYVVGNMVMNNNVWYSCKAGHTSSTANQPPNSTYWMQIPGITVSPALIYSDKSLVDWYGTWYSYQANPATWLWGNSLNPLITWDWQSGKTYNQGDAICYNNIWYTSKTDSNSGNTPSSSSSYWTSAATELTNAIASYAWSSGSSYNLGDVVTKSNKWYRCILAHTNQQPPNATYWSTNPKLGIQWNTYDTYAANSVVRYEGVWYYTSSSTSAQPPASPWLSAGTLSSSVSSKAWNSSTTYATNSYVAYGGVWYKCISGNTGKTPNNATYWSAVSAPVIYSQGTATLADNSAPIVTLVRAVVTSAPLLPNAAAGSTVTFGTGATVDSYDSNLGTYGTPASNVGYKAIIAGSSTSGTAVAVSSATIQGYLAAPPASSSPYGPLVTYSTSASLTQPGGAVNSPDSSATSVDLTRISRSPYIPQFDIQTPPAGSTISTPLSAPTTLGTAGAMTPSYYSYGSGLTLNSSNVVTIAGPVVLTVSGNLTISGGGGIVIKPTGSLRLCVTGSFQVGSGGINNQTLTPKNLVILLSATGSRTFSYTVTTQPLYGVIYQSGSSSTFSIGNNVVIYGAISAQNLTFGNSVTLHYDSALRTTSIDGVDSPRIITDWRELTNAAERITL